MAVIEFRTLGALDLRGQDGHQLHSLLAQPKRIALLAYLCVATSEGFHRRDPLLGLFWPDADEPHARTSLRNALHFLRHSLGEAALISRGDDEIAISSELVWCDASELTTQIASGECESALSLYRGDFLSGLAIEDSPTFERWVETQRTRLRECAAREARAAAKRHEREGHLGAAIHLAHRAVAMTDTDERAVRDLVELLSRAGDRVGALDVYDKFSRHIAKEFKAAPSAETRAVAERLRSEADANPDDARSGKVVGHATALPRIPGYAIEREIGRGGTSIVYLALDLKHDRPVAVKLLRPEIASLVGTDRFLAEISIVCRLSDPHIVPLLDSGVANELPYYVTPYVAGETLRALLRREKLLSVNQAVAIACDVADAINAAHRRGIVHRDVKPENILLESGHSVVTDFGIARAVTQAGGDRLTATGIAVGTAAYMSPEQATGTEVDERADIYSLACVLYEMLTGDPPFSGSTTQAILGRKAAEPAPPLRTVRETVPPALERSVLKALSRAPADRFQSVKEFADTIRHAATVDEVVGNAAKRPLGKGWRSKRFEIVAAAAVILALGVAVIAVRGITTQTTVAVPVARQVTYSGRATRPAISPDGQLLAYFAAQGDSQNLMLQDLAAASPPKVLAKVTETATAEWSPDGTQLLFGSFDRKRSRGLVFTMPRMGGDMRPLHIAETIGSGVWAYWWPDSVRRSSRVTLHADVDRRLLAVDLRTNDTAAIPISGHYDGIFDGQWSPRGTLFCGVMKTVAPVVWEIGIVRQDGRTSIVVEDSLPLGSPRWSATGDEVFYTRGNSSIWRLPVSPTTGKRTGEPQQVARDLEMLTGQFNRAADFALTRDGHRMAFARGRRYSNIWMIGTTRSSQPVLLTSGTALRWSPVVSPDGSWIAFVQETADAAEVFRMPIDGGPAVQVTSGARVSGTSSVAWSPDGKSIAYGSIRGGRSQIWVANVETGQTTPLTETSLSSFQSYLAWAPGSSIAYLDAEQFHVQLVNPVSGQIRTITPDLPWSIVQSPEYSPDGRSIAIAWNRGAGDFGVWIFDVAGSSPPKKIADGWLWPTGWSSDGRYVFARLYNANPTVYRLDTQERKPPEAILKATTAWRGFEQDTPVREMKCTPAGRLRPGFFVCAAFDFNSDIWIVDNFAPA